MSLCLKSDGMEKETLIEKIRQMETRKDLLDLLNEVKADLVGDENSVRRFSKKQFLVLCNPRKRRAGYRKFAIPKKSGGKRDISAPSGNLKWIQICLNEIFKTIYSPSDYAMGFTTGRSVVDNALIHTNQNYVFNIDLKDFFPSIDQARVWRRLQLAPFNFNKEIASVIAGLCCMEIYDTEGETVRYVLPQGAPTSPLLTNAICDTLDRRLHGLAKRFGLHYSRYADDITFSSMHNVYHDGSEFRKELVRIIAGQHFRLNEKKTRLQHCSGRQEVTGLTVGRKINVTQKYVKDVRAILHIWEKYGERAAYAVFYPRYKAAKGHIHNGEPNIENVISGKLCYLKMVKGETDPVYVKLKTQFNRVLDMAKPQYTQPWEYIFTIPKNEFEKKLGVKLEIRKSKEDAKPYATFTYDGRSFLVAISSNINPDAIPGDAEISLCRETNREQQRIKMIYMLQRRHRGNGAHQPARSELTPVVDDFWPILDLFSESNTDAAVTIPTTANSLLDRLVSSNFDLSILP